MGNGQMMQLDPANIVVDEGFNPRQDFDIQGILPSIKTNGVVQPLRVYQAADKSVHLNDGERRLRAALQARAEGCPILSVPCVLDDKKLSAEDRLSVALISNQGQKALTEYELGAAYKRYAEAYKWSLSQIAAKFLGDAKKTSTIQQAIDLLKASAELRR